MRRFVHRTFEGAMKATIGADFMVKEIELGQERIRFLIGQPIRTNKKSFQVKHRNTTNMGHRWW